MCGAKQYTSEARVNESNAGNEQPINMSFQDPENVQKREPTLAESRAREKARKEAIAAEKARWEFEQKREQNKSKRRKQLIGGGVALGLVGFVALAYSSGDDVEEVTAQCIDANDVIVDDDLCDTTKSVAPVSGSSLGYVSSPFVYVGPLGGVYRYSYGGSGQVGQKVVGGSSYIPRNKQPKTSSGKYVSSDGRSSRSKPSVSRGGFGSSSKSFGGSSRSSGS